VRAAFLFRFLLFCSLSETNHSVYAHYAYTGSHWWRILPWCLCPTALTYDHSRFFIYAYSFVHSEARSFGLGSFGPSIIKTTQLNFRTDSIKNYDYWFKTRRFGVLLCSNLCVIKSTWENFQGSLKKEKITKLLQNYPSFEGIFNTTVYLCIFFFIVY